MIFYYIILYLSDFSLYNFIFSIIKNIFNSILVPTVLMQSVLVLSLNTFQQPKCSCNHYSSSFRVRNHIVVLKQSCLIKFRICFLSRFVFQSVCYYSENMLKFTRFADKSSLCSYITQRPQ